MYIKRVLVRQLTNDVHIKYNQKEALNSAVRGFSFVCIPQRAGCAVLFGLLLLYGIVSVRVEELVLEFVHFAL